MNTWLTSRERSLIIEKATDAIVIWDFDGVVTDSEPLQASTYQMMLKNFGVSDTLNFAQYVGSTESTIWTALIKRYDLRPTLAELKEARMVLLSELAHKQLKSTWIVDALVDDLSKVCKKQVILSNGEISLIKSLLKAWGLDSILEIIQKPNEGRKREILSELLIKNKSLVFEDNQDTLDYARKRGAFCVGVVHSMFQENLIADVLLPIEGYKVSLQ